MKSVKSFVLGLTIAGTIFATGCGTTTVNTAQPSASASPAATASPVASATPAPALKPEEINGQQIRKAVTTLVSKVTGVDGTPKLLDSVTEAKGMGIKIRDNLIIIYLPNNASKVDFISTDDKPSVSDKFSTTVESLIGYAANSTTYIKPFGPSGSDIMGRFAIIAGKYAEDLKAFPVSFPKYDIVKSDVKIGDIAANATKNMFDGGKTLTITYSINDDGVRLEGDGYPIFMSKTSVSTPTNSGKLEKLADKDNILTFNSAAYLFGTGGKTNPTVTLPNLTWTTVLDAYQKATSTTTTQ